MLPILALPESLDIRGLHTVDDTTLLGDCMAGALNGINRKEILGKFWAHHDLLTKNFLEALKILLVVPQSNLLQHGLHDLHFLIFLEDIDWQVD